MLLLSRRATFNNNSVVIDQYLYSNITDEVMTLNRNVKILNMTEK